MGFPIRLSVNSRTRASTELRFLVHLGVKMIFQETRVFRCARVAEPAVPARAIGAECALTDEPQKAAEEAARIGRISAILPAEFWERAFWNLPRPR
jgi:hypothetical protein